MKAILNKASFKSFTAALSDADIKCTMHMTRAHEPEDSGIIVEVIEGISNAMPWTQLANVIKTWINAKTSREIIICMNDNNYIHAKGYSTEEIRKLLVEAKSIKIVEGNSE